MTTQAKKLHNIRANLESGLGGYRYVGSNAIQTPSGQIVAEGEKAERADEEKFLSDYIALSEWMLLNDIENY